MGYLSAEDADGYLRGAVSKGGRPVITGVMRDRIVSASAGLPLYLDLAVNTYLDIASRGRRPAAADFGQPLPAVTARMLRDLDRDERELLRAGALVEGFSLATLLAGCPQVPDAAIARFKNRLFLEYDPERVWQYSLHDVLRDAILEADVGLSDSWSARERGRVAARMVSHLRDIFSSAKSANDRALKVAAFQQAVDLCVTTRQFSVWLVGAAHELANSGIWNMTTATTPVTGIMSAFLQGLTGVRERRSGQLSKAISALNAALGQDGLPDDLSRFLILHRGHALRVAGHYAEAAEDYAVLATGADGYSHDAVYWLADYSFLAGRFDEALSSLDSLTGLTPQLRGEVLRLRGHVHRVNGLFAAAEGHYRAALALGRETANFAAIGKALTDLVQTLSWRRPDDVTELHAEGVEINTNLRNRVELVKLHAAFAVTAVNLGDFSTAENEIQSGMRLTEDCGYPGGLIWCWVAAAFSHLRQGNRDAYANAVDHVVTVTENVGGNRFWADIASWWASDDDRADPGAQWIGGTASARERWRSVFGDGSSHD